MKTQSYACAAPWRVEARRDPASRQIALQIVGPVESNSPESLVLAQIKTALTPWGDQTEANARLMAPSPALFTMLEAVLGHAGSDTARYDDACQDDEMNRSMTFENARDLLARVKGEAQQGDAAPAAPDLRDLALGARAERLEGFRHSQETQERAQRKQREARQPAARALIEAKLEEICDPLPQHEIEWVGQHSSVVALVHLGEVTLRASFRADSFGAPQAVTFTYRHYYFDNLAELGKLIEEHEQCLAHEQENDI